MSGDRSCVWVLFWRVVKHCDFQWTELPIRGAIIWAAVGRGDAPHAHKSVSPLTQIDVSL